MEWTNYRKKGSTPMVEYKDFITFAGQLPDKVSISEADKDNGSPKEGDMIARNPDDPDDMWLISKEYFEENYTEVEQ